MHSRWSFRYTEVSVCLCGTEGPCQEKRAGEIHLKADGDPVKVLRKRGLFVINTGNCEGLFSFLEKGLRILYRLANEYRDVTNEYVEAAVGIKAAGFDGMLMRMGHSILLAQFFSPYTNKRTDEYGGSTENHCRYAVEIIDAVRKAVGPDFTIDVRISGTEYQKGGIDIEEGLRIAEILQDHCDILQASCGMHNSDWMTWTHPCGFLPPNHNMFIAETWKKSGRINKCLISTIGGLTNLSDCEKVLAAGNADFVVVAREFNADPEWIKKDLAGRAEDIVPGIKCMRCHDSDNYAQHLQCAVNPKAGLGAPIERIPAKPEREKNVAVIGGGPAGMYAALVCAESGRTVEWCTKEAFYAAVNL